MRRNLAALGAAGLVVHGATAQPHSFFVAGTNEVSGPVISRSAFYGSAAGLTNATPSLATNTPNPNPGAVLTASGDRLKWADRWQLKVDDVLSPKFIIASDEFCFGGHGHQTAGEWGWYVIANGGSIGQGWGTNRPGVRALRSGTAVSNYVALTFYTPDWGQGWFVSTAVSNWFFRFEFRMPELCTNGQFLLGVSRSPIAAPTWSNPPPGVWLYITNSTGNFRFLGKPNSGDWVATIVSNSTVTIDSDWHTFDISMTNGTTVPIVYVRLDSEPTIQIPVTNFFAANQILSPYMSSTTGEGAEKRLFIDRVVFVSSAR